jgi:hypothetical protein
MAKNLKITNIDSKDTRIRRVELVGVKLTRGANAPEVEIRYGDVGHPVTIVLDGRIGDTFWGAKRLELDDCLTLAGIPAAEINTDVLVKAVEVDEIVTADQVLWELYSVIIAKTATIRIEWLGDDHGEQKELGEPEISITLTLGNYVSELRCPAADLERFLVPS